MKKEKKKKGCLGRIIKFIIVCTVVLFGAAFLLDDGEDYDYISQQEIDSGEEDVSWSDLIDMFFDYYGYYPDENDNDDYYYSDYYDNNDYDSYAYNDDYSSPKYDNFYRDFDRNNDYEDYYNDYSYDNDYDDWNYEEKPSKSKNNNTSAVTSQTVSNGSLSKFVECAKSYLGTPYVWGGNSRSGIDCSGLVYNAAQEAGLGTLPRTAKTLHAIATKIDKKDLSEGDLVFFSSSGTISHVAIYLGNNQMIHAISEGNETGVVISKLNKDYWKKHYYSSGRIMSSSVTEKRAQARAQSRNY